MPAALGQCPANQVYQECGEACVKTCSNPQHSCSSFCTFGCFCPEGEPAAPHRSLQMSPDAGPQPPPHPAHCPTGCVGARTPHRPHSVPWSCLQIHRVVRDLRGRWGRVGLELDLGRAHRSPGAAPGLGLGLDQLSPGEEALQCGAGGGGSQPKPPLGRGPEPGARTSWGQAQEWLPSRRVGGLSLPQPQEVPSCRYGS